MKIDLGIRRKVLIEKHSKDIEKELFFLSFLDGCELKLSKAYPYSVFYIKNGEPIFQQDFKYKNFWITYHKIWSVFEFKYLMNYYQVQSLTKDILEKHLKVDDFTPSSVTFGLIIMLEKRLTLEGFTPEMESIVSGLTFGEKLNLYDVN